MLMNVNLIMIVIIIGAILLNIAQSVIVNTSIGPIEGTDGIDVNTFFGIPFAKPPINELRLQSPQPMTDPIGNETNPFQANGVFENVSACIQPSLPGFEPNIMSEDCLYLNIFTPSDAEYLKTNYTVMVWIYGGGYSVGYIAQYDATNFVEFIGDIIIVTVNYRLGVLGFLYDNMFDTDVIGNYGYQDQKLGIKWVHDNIKYFGGNPDNINIFGESAGGGAVSLQLLYNKDGYIKSGIMQSPWAGPAFSYKTPTTWDDTISQFNALTNCTGFEADSNELLNCWRDLETDKIIEAQNILSFAYSGFFFVPTVETSELLYQPLLGFTNGKIDNIPPYVIGANKNEGGGGRYIFESYQQALETIATDIVEGDLEIAASILQFYNVTETSIAIGKDDGEIFSDYWRCSVRYLLELLVDKTDNIYIYDFDIIDTPLYKSVFAAQPGCWNITCHGADVGYFFTWDVEYENKTIELQQDLQILWSNFAKTLNPNDDGSGEGRIDLWPQYTNTDGTDNYIQFTFDAFNSKSTDSDEYIDICPFWNKVGYAGNYSNPYNDTTSTTTIVNTTIGQIEGNTGTNVNTFFGIPYAKPPVDELRFASPEPITESIGDETNPFQAIEFDPKACIQPSDPLSGEEISMSEDCLYLSIFTPSDAEYLTTNYTVMVWIHGGGYINGAGLDEDPSNFVSYIGDIIIVMINYRLGALGFLYDNSFDTGINGNFGYEDQKMAIKWVHDNIKYFGGNPDNINIFGESAGGSSVSLQLLYNKDGYIKSGIMQSPGDRGINVAFPTPVTLNDTTSQFNALTNCTQYESDSTQLLNCWRNLDANTILTAQDIISPFYDPVFIPTVETTELLYQPLWGFTNGEIDDIPPYIIGTNDGEAFVFLYKSNSYQGLLSELIDIYNDLEIAQSILDYYGITEVSSPSSSYFLDNAQIYTDSWRCSVRYLLESLGDNTDNIYNYNFDVVEYELNKNVYWGEFVPSCWNITCHLIDVWYLFNTDYWTQFDEYTNETLAITQTMQTLWSNFAKYLNPNGNDDNDHIIWPQYTNSDDMNNYLEFEGYNEYNKKSTFDDDRTDVCKFWNKVGYAGNYSNPYNDTESTTPIVNTTIGYIEGYTFGDVNAFVGIPYAKPPVDELRFASPEPITESIGDETNPYQAIELDPKACIQPADPLSSGEMSMSEDCLYLSIVTPSDAEYLTTNYTVMVWIHGGAYVVGAGLGNDPSNFVSYIGDIIVVLINYRLGALGFLYDNLFDTGINGNFGYEDQKMAIKWVHDNIKYFGGNPDNINIFGESAGGGAVSLQLLYNKDGHIKSGIMQSPWAGPYVAYPTPVTLNDTVSQFNALTNCTQYESDSTQLLNCWRNLDANTILTAQDVVSPTEDAIFIPTVETTELLYQPLWGFTNGEIDDIPPYIIGTNNGEGFMVLEDYIHWSNSYQGLLSELTDEYNDLEIAHSILDYYGITEITSPSSSYYLDNAQIVSDSWRCSVRYLLELLGDNTDNIYNYEFDVVEYELNKNLLWGSFLPSCWNVTCHGIDVWYLFNTDYWTQFDEYTDETLATTHKMQTLWSNFAKYLNPNGNGDNDDIIWPQYTNSDDMTNYLDFEGYDEYNKKSTFDDDRTDVCEFWNKVGYSGMYSDPNEIITTIDNDSKAASYFVFGCSFFIFLSVILLL